MSIKGSLRKSDALVTCFLSTGLTGWFEQQLQEESAHSHIWSYVNLLEISIKQLPVGIVFGCLMAHQWWVQNNIIKQWTEWSSHQCKKITLSKIMIWQGYQYGSFSLSFALDQISWYGKITNSVSLCKITLSNIMIRQYYQYGSVFLSYSKSICQIS